MIIGVRPAVVDDVAGLAELEIEARTALVGTRGGDRWLADHPAFGMAWPVGDDDWLILVATIDDVVVGFLVAAMSSAVVTVHAVYVLVGAREVGLGDELLSEAIAAGRARGAKVLDGVALPGDRQTKNLYERAGIKARLIITSAEI